jgi:hypothetical protein
MANPWTFEKPSTLMGRRIKAGFHCHTMLSDGGLSPEETVERYYARGFQCLGITDHFRVTPVDRLPGGDFLGIDATENGGMPDIIGVGVHTPVPRDLPLAERATLLAAQGGFTIAAHPTYCAVLPGAYAECSDLMAMEIYNAYCDAAYANGYALELWDMVLGLGKRIWGVAGDDAHLNPRKRHYSDAGFGWVEIWAGALEKEPVLRALKQGAFFSTQGPVFEQIMVAEGTIRLLCSPVTQVRWRTFGSEGHVDYAPQGSALTCASLPSYLQLNKYVRIELVDHEGKRAWSNPFFVSSEPA